MQTVLNGYYKVEANTEKNEFTPYYLVGKRGARYAVRRNRKNPKALFAMVGKETFWFTEEGGRLNGAH